MTLYTALISLCMTSASGCSTLDYYAQSIHGHMEIMNKRQPILELLEKNNINPELTEKLKLILKIREFAISELILPANDSYLEYADLEREYVVWNVFITPAYSIQLEQWCFLIAGCLSYKGFYSKEKAEIFANEFKAENYDVYIGGVRAYSTLGWFKDPVLNTMLLKDETYLAKLIFHELAHQKVYLKNDTEFNEALAEAIARIGVIKWLEYMGDSDKINEFKTQLVHDDQLFELVLEYQQKLDILYQSEQGYYVKGIEKQAMLESMHEQFRNLSNHWNNDNRYDTWFYDGLNNAKLAAIVTYQKLVPAFITIFNLLNNDIAEFYNILGNFEKCSKEKRRKILLKSLINFKC